MSIVVMSMWFMLILVAAAVTHLVCSIVTNSLLLIIGLHTKMTP